MARRLLSARTSRATLRREREKPNGLRNLMKSITTKEFISLVAIAIAAPLLTLAVLNASLMLARGNGLLLLALTLCGAVVSGINGFGRRTVRASSSSRSSREGPRSTVALPS